MARRLNTPPPQTKPDPGWLKQTAQAINALASHYGFEEVTVHVGPITAVRCLNISWESKARTKATDYISLTLPDDDAPAQVYADALSAMMYGEEG